MRAPNIWVMMKAGTALLIGGGIVATYLAIDVARTANAGDRLQVDLKTAGYRGAKDGMLNFVLNMQAANPSDQELRLDGCYLDVAVPGAGQLAQLRAGKAELQGGLRLKPNAVTQFAIPFQVSKLSAVLTCGTALVNAVISGTLPREVSIVGEIKVNSIPVQYNERIPFKKEAPNA